MVRTSMKNCGNTVQNALRAVPGVTNAEVSFDLSSARVVGSASVEALVDAVDTVGFGAALVESPPVAPAPTVSGGPFLVELDVEGMMW